MFILYYTKGFAGCLDVSLFLLLYHKSTFNRVTSDWMKNNQSFILYAGSYSGRRSTPLHFHTGVELVYIASGSCSCLGQHGEFQVDAGQFLVIPPELKHRQVDLMEVVKFYVVFESSQSEFPMTMQLVDTTGDTFVGIWMEQLFQLYSQRQLEECNLLLQLLLCHLKDRRHGFEGENKMPAILRAALDFMYIHFAEGISIGEVATELSCSISYFNTLFNQHLHQNPSFFLRQIRMAEAQKLLLQGYCSVKEISEKCGYRTAHYFCRVFRQMHGCTPGDFRSTRPRHKITLQGKDHALLFNSWYNNRKKNSSMLAQSKD